MIDSAVVVMRRSRTASCRAGLCVNRVLLGANQHKTQQDAVAYGFGPPKANFGWELGPFIMALVNHSPASKKENYSTD